MGTWGTAITSDDTVADVIGIVVDRMKAGDSLQAASKAAMLVFNDSLKDPDEAPLIWLALAHVQWKYGCVEPDVLERVQEDIAGRRGLKNWRASDIKKRKQVLDRFAEKISSANPKPSSPPKTIVRLAPFAEGDCLAVLTSSGKYTAAIVLRTDNSSVEYGKNLIGALDYLSNTLPNPADFEARRWLFKHHHNWKGQQELHWYVPGGFRKVSKRISVVGKISLIPSDPSHSDSYSGWHSLGEQILLCRAHQDQD